jgi:hypothetical protein
MQPLKSCDRELLKDMGKTAHDMKSEGKKNPGTRIHIHT